MMANLARKLVVAIPLLALCMKGGVSVEAQMIVALLVAVAVILAVVYGRSIPAAGWVLRNTSLLAGFLPIYVLLQAYMPAWSNHSFNVWSATWKLTGTNETFVSLAPADTVASVVAITNPVLLFCCGLLLCRDDQLARAMISVLARGGAALVVCTLVLFVVDPTVLLIWKREHYLGSFTATFVNRNTAATFTGVVVLLLVGQLVRKSDRKLVSAMPRWVLGDRIADKQRGELKSIALDAALLIACILGLVLTLSRAGIASSLLALMFLLCLRAWTGAENRERSAETRWSRFRPWLISLSIILVLAATSFLLTGLVQLRMASGVAGEARFCIYPAIMRAIADNWQFGAGFGAFKQSFAAYQPAACGLDGTWERAHNFFLEGMLGLGIVFVPILLLSLWTLGQAFRLGLIERRQERVYPAVGLAILLLVFFHSTLDFSLQVPGFAMYFSAALAPLVILSLGRHKACRT